MNRSGRLRRSVLRRSGGLAGAAVAGQRPQDVVTPAGFLADNGTAIRSHIPISGQAVAEGRAAKPPEPSTAQP
jgi:hypothetical protein